jgi:hypothetical protein
MDLDARMTDIDRSRGLKAAMDQACRIRGFVEMEPWLNRHYWRINMYHKDYYELKEVDRWCRDSIPDKWHRNFYKYWFESREEAMLFRLRWID